MLNKAMDFKRDPRANSKNFHEMKKEEADRETKVPRKRINYPDCL